MRFTARNMNLIVKETTLFKLIKRTALLSVILGGLFSCKPSSSATLFTELSSSKTGIEFINTIEANDVYNIISFEYFYNGGGVAVADFNQDGLQDLVFSGNLVSNKMYLNQGEMSFEDVTEVSGVGAMGKWCSGITIVDINTDGLPDIYFSVHTLSQSEDRKNMLFINNGNDENGIPTFTEMAAAYKINDEGHSMNAVFFDYDNDSDLDLYILTNQLERQSPNKFFPKRTNGEAPGTDRLYRNEGIGPDGHPVFKNVSFRSGISHEGYGLGINVVDINRDGWKDLYITNDYLSNDLLYINNQDGTFTNKVRDYIKHQSHSAMGNDVVDINNDGWSDIITLDMLPRHNQRIKMMQVENKYSNYVNSRKLDYDYQYMRNTLQINSGIDPNGKQNFSDVGYMAGVNATDWSWAPLVADFDHDGLRDMVITNGFPKDVTDMDFVAFRSFNNLAFNKQEILDAIPEIDISNFAFKNNGDLSFGDVTKDWGFSKSCYSNGGAYADLDNDGDLDIIINNINSPASIYQNNLLSGISDSTKNYLRLKINGTGNNKDALGAIVQVHVDDQILYHENSPYRGYLSSMEPFIHFGLGNANSIDSMFIEFQGKRVYAKTSISANQILNIDLDLENLEAQPSATVLNKEASQFSFENKASEKGLDFIHYEHVFTDYNIQRLLMHQYTQMGPSIAIGDLDNNGEDDFFIGGSLDFSGTIFKQKNGQFEHQPIQTEGSKKQEDIGTVIFDADNDGDQDLYIVSGSYEQAPNTAAYQDRFYTNDGRGNLTLNQAAIPQLYTSGSCVKAADYDGDGDLDLFVGGRVEPGSYPNAVSSYILRNESTNGQAKFVDASNELCPELNNIGMVTDALWTDFNNDQKFDLILTGEWMPITFLKNTGSGFENVTKSSGIGKISGWWNSITAADFDNDGDTDYIVGNHGNNSVFQTNMDEPITCYAGDFDDNGSVDPICTTYLLNEDGTKSAYPVHARDDIIKQLVKLRKKFKDYDAYSRATIDSILTKEQMDKARILKVNNLASSYIENLGNSTFKMSNLPTEVQVAPVFGTLPFDYNDDGNIDVLLIGNNFGTDVFWGRQDALNGLILEGDGAGNFIAKRNSETGFFVDQDGRSLVNIHQKDNKPLFLATQNMDFMKVYQQRSNTEKTIIKAEAMDAWAEVILANGKTRKEEFYYGNSYLSQSSRVLYLPADIKSVSKFNFKGNKKEAL